jgi:hypothetical protein
MAHSFQQLPAVAAELCNVLCFTMGMHHRCQSMCHTSAFRCRPVLLPHLPFILAADLDQLQADLAGVGMKLSQFFFWCCC